MAIRFINPLVDIGSLLLGVEKPARYTGGEYGLLCKRGFSPATLNTLIAFPDLYEIGMSNQALRILYNRLNRMEGVFCDRAFAVAPDFEELLRNRKLPLYGLDTGISLKDVDLLMFTLGYELGIGGIFSILDLSGIPLRSCERQDDDPLLILGGPCVSNPLPYALFIDAFWIGEAEGGFFELVESLAAMKKNGATRNMLLERLAEHPSVWTKEKGRAVRAVDGDFSSRKDEPAVFPVPSMKVIHHHGAVEIMRGCPNGCRFCHAGYWYRPMRQKELSIVKDETRAFIKKGGYREITLSSLSSGDYQHLDDLIESLNSEYRGERVSFQLPSLKVSSFALELLDKISQVRKSGLTFAVETPLQFWQMAINKHVSGEDIVSILREAKRHGWRSAKFYFMIGLPLKTNIPGNPGELASEEEEIIAFIEKTSRQAGMRFNINIGTFIPKPHTPFERSGQMSHEEAKNKLFFLRGKLKSLGHNVGIQDPLISVIEGILSRGDERAGLVFEEAYRLGSRLDAWSEFFNRDIWTALLQKHENLVEEFLKEKGRADELSWKSIDSGISENYFESERKKTNSGTLTSTCMNNCNNPCGICNKDTKIVQNNILSDVEPVISQKELIPKKKDPDTYRILFSFSKQKSAIYHSHLGLLEIYSMAFLRAGIPIHYTQGFNPLPRLEIASPLSLGIRAKGEIALIETEDFFNAIEFKDTLNKYLPDGIVIERAMNIYIPSGEKKYSVSSLLWGYVYSGKNNEPIIVPAKEEKAYREAFAAKWGSIEGLERISLLAKTNGEADSYFTAYSSLYPDSGMQER